MGSLPGIRVDVRPPDAAQIGSAALRVCWDGYCDKAKLEFRPSSTSVPLPCEGDEPDAVCGASASPDGGKTAFAKLRELPEEPVEIMIDFADADGDGVVGARLRVTPEATYPAGPDCPKSEPQVRVVLENGKLTER
ncbi:hypothetical protein BJF79_34975 [Actinomadura sp. CNU-125]|nr:hypothetical protein BJF79_34975 [Actinomadura sp. CNU-125]